MPLNSFDLLRLWYGNAPFPTVRFMANLRTVDPEIADFIEVFQ